MKARVEQLERARAASRTRARWFISLSGAGVLLASGLTWAANGNCPNGLPFCFVGDQPARASQVNHNFAQVKEWVEAKVGTVSAGTPSTATVVVANQTVNGAASFGSATRQMLNLWGSVYGIGVQPNTQYFRTAGGFAWYQGGTHLDTQNEPGAGGSRLMSLTSPGNLTVATVSGNVQGNVTGNLTGAVNGVIVRVKGGNNGSASCDQYCQSTVWAGWAGACLGTRRESDQAYTTDCAYTPGTGTNLTCLCGTW